MNLTQIQHFLELAETLNFTSAAKASGVTQPTLTRSIQRLEDQLGGRLLYRDGKDTRLTALGLSVQAEFAKIVQSDKRIKALAHANKHGTLEKLNLGIASSVAPMRFARFVSKSLDLIPMLEVILHPISTNSGIELVLAGTLDGCFVAEADKQNAKLSVIDLFKERLLVGFAANHRFSGLDIVPAEELKHESYIDRLNCEFRESVHEFLMRKDALPYPRLRSEREDWLQDVVTAGGGICMLPEHSVIAKGMALRPVAGLDLQRQVSFVSISGSGTSMVVQEFRKLLSQETWI